MSSLALAFSIIQQRWKKHLSKCYPPKVFFNPLGTQIMVSHEPVLISHVFKPVNISICALPLAGFDLIQRLNEGLLFHPPATSRCVCVSGCQSHCSRVTLWLLFAPEPVNQWELGPHSDVSDQASYVSVHPDAFGRALKRERAFVSYLQ